MTDIDTKQILSKLRDLEALLLSLKSTVDSIQYEVTQIKSSLRGR